MDKIHRRLGRLGFGAKRAMAISRLEKIASDPELVMKIALVKEERKRDYKKMSKGQEKKAAQKTMKTERRINNLDDEMAKQK
jgi:single-stranded DNA-specific DHH superfamily exonuclease